MTKQYITPSHIAWWIADLIKDAGNYEGNEVNCRRLANYLLLDLDADDEESRGFQVLIADVGGDPLE